MTKLVINCESGEVIERELNDDEIAQSKIDNAKYQERIKLEKAEAKAKETERQAILDRLGLTADEAKLLLG